MKIKSKSVYQTLAIIILALAIGCSDNLFAQSVTKDAQGNFHAQTRAQQDSSTATATGKTYTDAKGETYPVFQSKNGKLFVRRVAKTSGRTYNMYLKF